MRINLNRKTRLISLVPGLLLLYGAGSWSIDSGSMLVYGLTTVILVAIIWNCIQLFKEGSRH